LSRTELSIQEVAILATRLYKEKGGRDIYVKSRENFVKSTVFEVGLPPDLMLKISNRDYQLLAFLIYTNQIFFETQAPSSTTAHLDAILPSIDSHLQYQYPYSTAM
jgi:hypothetical protein